MGYKIGDWVIPKSGTNGVGEEFFLYDGPDKFKPRPINGFSNGFSKLDRLRYKLAGLEGHSFPAEWLRPAHSGMFYFVSACLSDYDAKKG